MWRGSRGWAHPGGPEEPELVQKLLAGGRPGGLCRLTKMSVGPVRAPTAMVPVMLQDPGLLLPWGWGALAMAEF